MRLLALVVVVMVAFAANSVLNRAAVGAGLISPMGFGVVRLVAGAGVLGLLSVVLRGPRRLGAVLSGDWLGLGLGVLSLLAYIFGFSLAYVALDSGIGALILFGTVQVTMFAGAIFAGERVHGLRLLGAGLAFLGLVWLVWPGDGSGEAATVGVMATLFMVLAGIGWGIYSLVGRRAQDALLSTAANFILAVPLAFAGASVLVPGMWEAATGQGILLALVSGGVTSGLGYALWYAVLLKLAGSVAAVAQLTVPMIAMAGGMVFLGEALTGRFALASVVILGGVALSVLGPRYFARSSKGS